MERVLQLDPDIFYGTAHLVLAAYYGSRPPMLGGDPERAEAHLETLRRVAGKDFLLAPVYRARYLLTLQQDREAFLRVLTEVIRKGASTEAYPLLNRVAVEKARLYRSAADRLFP
jgi:hypothetical protein